MLKRLTAKAALVATSAALLGATLTGGTASAATTSPYIGDGYSNNTHAVWCVQRLINYAIDRGYYYGLAKVAEDGKWGPKTKGAVIFAQRSNGFPADGIVGPQTGDQLMMDGDPYYTGGGAGDGYCHTYIPTTY
ncbi:peptidoglycan-binding protein [Streptomyces sp. NPDC058745]|uniref:peptidoglycan-binding domain-containing protein n=1 Tax=unclassified Streptomyces TaxID=2593676 RepID=UPI0036A3B7C7